LQVQVEPTAPVGGWEERWDNFHLEEYGKWRIDRNVAKGFIRNEIAAAIKNREREIAEGVEKMRKDERAEKPEGVDRYYDYELCRTVGHNAALTDVLALINKQ
jgi:hypothetical protein